MKKYIKRFRELKVQDYLAIFILPFAYLVSLFYRKKNQNLILIIESGFEARDNGYWLFKYLCEHEKEANAVYVIDFKSTDYVRVKDLGKCIQYQSFKHWVYYLSSGVNVSSQKGGKPNAAVFYLLEVVFKILKNKRIFLQHGITKDDADWLYYNNTTFRLFICGALPEYEFIKKRFGYPSENVAYLGFSRFDMLHDVQVNRKRILLMPTWREWLVTKTDAHYKFSESQNFNETEYYIRWNNFMNNPKLIKFLEENDLELIFYPHRNMQPFIELFQKNSEQIVIASWKEYDIQELLKTSAMMITDYSSVFMDFAYMQKPMLFYQFDYEKFREGQYQEGYFSYERDGFGPVFYQESDEMFDFLVHSFNNNFELDEYYLSRMQGFFELRDQENSKRIYESIKTILNE